MAESVEGIQILEFFVLDSDSHRWTLVFEGLNRVRKKNSPGFKKGHSWADRYKRSFNNPFLNGRKIHGFHCFFFIPTFVEFR